MTTDDVQASRPPKPLDPISKDFRTGISIAVLLGCAAGIGWLLGYGSPTNSIHESALTGFFTTGVLVMAGMGISSMVPEVMKLYGR